MKRDVVYSLNQEFVYVGTRSTEAILPGTLLVAKEKHTKELFRFYQKLSSPLNGQTGLYLENYLKTGKESDLRRYPLIYLESDVVFRNDIHYHMFSYMGKEIYLQQEFRFFKPLFFDGYNT